MDEERNLRFFLFSHFFKTKMETSVSNVLHVFGTKAAVTEFFTKCRTEKSPFSFSRYVKPDDSNSNSHAISKWEIDNWGTTRDAFDVKEPVFNPSHLTMMGQIDFETTWSYPDKWLQTVSKLLPELVFVLVWADEKGTGRVSFNNGSKIEKINDDDDGEDDDNLTHVRQLLLGKYDHASQRPKVLAS